LMHAMNIKKPAALHAQVGNFVTWVWNNQCLRNDALWQRTRNVDFISC
jgi:plastocyanin